MTRIVYSAFVIVAFFINKDVSQRKILTLSSSKDIVLENTTVALTCSHTGGTLVDTKWLINGHEIGTCARIGSTCLKYRLLNNTEEYNCRCNTNGTFTVLSKNVNRSNHDEKWLCREGENSNTVVIKVLVPVTRAILQQFGKEATSENKSVQFSCTSYSLPAPKILWYLSPHSSRKEITNNSVLNIVRQTFQRKDKVILVNESLTYKVNRSVDGWNIFCTAENEKQNATTSNEIMLSVVYPPDQPPQLKGFLNGSTYRVVENETAHLQCLLEGGNPPAKPNLLCNGSSQIISKTSSNVSWTATRADNGRMCICLSGHELSSDFVYVNIEVLYPPDVPTIQLNNGSETKNITSNIKLIEDMSYHLKCSADANPPPLEYSWVRPFTTGILNNSTLNLPDVKQNQNGVYICYAKNIIKTTHGETYTKDNNKSIEVDILYKPTLAELKNRDIAEGERFKTTCEVISANPNKTDFKWTGSEADLNIYSNELILLNVSRHDSMNYTCTVKNHMKPTVGEEKEGCASETFFLNVWYRASVDSFVVNDHENYDRVAANESTNITFTCKIDSNPNSNVILSSPTGKNLSTSDTNTIEYTLFLSSCLDAGIYSCSGQNGYNYGQPEKAYLSVFVKCTPMASLHIEKDIRSNLYAPVTLQFEGIAYPEPEFTWQKWANSSWNKISNDDIFSTSSFEMQSNLTINNFTTTTANTYRLIVGNEIGTLIQKYTLLPLERPGTPTDFRHIKELLTDSSVTFIWRPGFNGGIPQTFIIMYGEEKDKERNNITTPEDGNTVMNVTVHGLSSDTSYIFELFAVNSEGISGSVALQSKTKSHPVDAQRESSAMTGIVLGVISFMILAIAITVFVIFRLRYQKTRNTGNKERPYDNLTEMRTMSGEKNSVIHEPVYEGLRPDTERGVDERKEQEYEILKPEQGSCGTTIPIYTNLKL